MGKPIKVTIELTDEVIYGIARSQALHNAYDRLSEDGVKNDLTEMYAVSFADGMEYLRDLLSPREDEKQA